MRDSSTHLMANSLKTSPIARKQKSRFRINQTGSMGEIPNYKVQPELIDFEKQLIDIQTFEDFVSPTKLQYVSENKFRGVNEGKRKEWMIKSCASVLEKVEKTKFEKKKILLTRKREIMLMQRMEDLKKKKKKLGRCKSTRMYPDRHERMADIKKQSIFNVQSMMLSKGKFKLRVKNPNNRKKAKTLRKKVSSNQYFQLQTYIKKKTQYKKERIFKLMHDEDDRDRLTSAEKLLVSKKKEKKGVWEDYRYNPKTTLLLTKRVKGYLKRETKTLKKEKKRLNLIGNKIRSYIILDRGKAQYGKQ